MKGRFLSEHLQAFQEALTLLDMATSSGRTKHAGLFEAPPAMVESIGAWLSAQAAGRIYRDIQNNLRVSKQNYETSRLKMKPALASTSAWVADPTSYPAYKKHREESSYWGYLPKKVSIRDFQKMTPVKAKALSNRAKQEQKGLLNTLSDYGYGKAWKADPTLTKQLQKLKPYLNSASDSGDWTTLTKEFPIDLRGWKYGGPEILKAIEAQVGDEIAARMAPLRKRAPKQGDKALLQEFEDIVMENLHRFSKKSIVVSLSLVNTLMRKARGHWNPDKGTLEVVMPKTNTLSALKDLDATLRHELQHVGQWLLASSLGLFSSLWDTKRKPSPGMPSKKIMTPTFLQHYDQALADGKTLPALKPVLRKLRTEGVPLGMVRFHALDDLEFYTRLADSIRSFKAMVRQVGGMNTEDLKAAIRLWTGDVYARTVDEVEALGSYDKLRYIERDSFFLTLLKVPSARGKWKKAVSILYKTVS